MTPFAELRQPKTVSENKLDLLTQLSDVGFGAFSWATGSVPSGMVEIQASALTSFQEAVQVIAEGALNSTATGEVDADGNPTFSPDGALDVLSREVYDNVRFTGLFTRGEITLTDSAGAGPFKFQGSAVSFSVGVSGLRYDGTGGSLTLPQSGQVRVPVTSVAVGAEYAQVAVGAVDTFARGAIPGVSVENTADWISAAADGQSGTDPEEDAALRERNTSKWATFGVGSPEAAYVEWARTASQEVKKVAVYTNLEMLDPGRVDVIVAGESGPVGAGVVAAVQNYIAPAQVGGERIPETARAVASSALGAAVAVTATLFVQAAYNTASFQATVAANVAAYFADLPIGGLVSAERVVEVLLYPAGLSAGVIVDATVMAPAADAQLEFDEVAQPVVTLAYVSV